MDRYLDPKGRISERRDCFVLCLVVFLALAGAARAQPVVSGVEPIGVFATDIAGYGRDAGYSGRIGSRILWVFGDTITPTTLRSATAGWSSPEDPFVLAEATDSENAPLQFLPLSADERTFDAAHLEPPACCKDRHGCPSEEPYCHCEAGGDCATRIALWPGDVIDLGARTGVVFYEELVIGAAPYDFRPVGTGLARIREGLPAAMRLMDDRGNPVLLFRAPEPNFFRAVAAEEEGGWFVYVYAAVGTEVCRSDILIGRVPRERIEHREDYRFWNGSGWVADLEQARPILRGVSEKLGSVAWNDHLGSWVSGFSSLCTGGTFHLRTAPRPEGPWSEATVVDLSPLGVAHDSYAGALHPELGSGRSMVISYYQPLPEVVGEVRLARLLFQ